MIDLTQVPPTLFWQALESNLRRFKSSHKAEDHFLGATRLHMNADAVGLFTTTSYGGTATQARIEGDATLLDPGMIRAFSEHADPQLPNDRLLSPLVVRGRAVGVLAAARTGRDFERGSGHTLNRASRLLGADLTRREDERVTRVLDRIREKVVAVLRPRDLAYQILHGLHRLVHHDHSAALLIHDPDVGALRVEAEKLIWTKSESAFIGHETPITEEQLETLRRASGIRVLSDEGSPGEDATDRLLSDLLVYNRGPGIPAASSILYAPLCHEFEFLGLLKLAVWKRPAFDEYDLEVVERFLPAAIVALRNARVTRSLENQAMQAEMRAGLVTLARAVAHDVNNAIGGILPLAEQLREEVRENRLDPSSLEQDLDVIVDKAMLCKRIFSNMLRVGTERSGSGPLNVNQIVSQMLPMLEAQLAPRRVRLVASLAPQLPLIRFSKQHIERIVWNLVTNSAEAIGSNSGGRGRIEIETRLDEDDVIVLTVRDNGPGIEPELLPKVHEPFFTTKRAGTGLGLALCRSMAWQYGGTMQIRSDSDQGTTVEIRLPGSRGPASEPQT